MADRKPKAFSGWVIPRNEWDARHSDGRRTAQVRAAVLAPSRKAAVAALVTIGLRDVTVGHLTRYWSETGNQETLEALAAHEPGTVLLRSLDPGGIVLGVETWTPAPILETNR